MKKSDRVRPSFLCEKLFHVCFFLFHSPSDEFLTAPLRVTINLQALADNWREMAKRSGKARAGAVVKADGYGIGIEDAGQTLYNAGVRDFSWLCHRKARPCGPMRRTPGFSCCQDLGGMEPLFFEHDLVPVIASEEQLAFWMRTVTDHGDHPCALHVDTGFNRLGLSMDDALFLATDVSRPASFSPVLILSHLACADDPFSSMNQTQLQAFHQVSAAFEGIESSLSASAGTLLGPDYHFDLTRPGIALYGGEAVTGLPNPMRPVVKAEARILQIRQARNGETVSYGATCQLRRDSRLAIASVGYADGYLRNLSGHGTALRNTGLPGAYGSIAGYQVPVAGRITMDMTIFDVSDVPEKAIAAGDYIELFGTNMPIDDVARAAGTIGYEMLTGLGLRYERHYFEAE